MGCGILSDIDDMPVGINKNDIEGNMCLIHPEVSGLKGVEYEEHAVHGMQAGPVHEALHPYADGLGDFDRDGGEHISVLIKEIKGPINSCRRGRLGCYGLPLFHRASGYQQNAAE